MLVMQSLLNPLQVFDKEEIICISIFATEFSDTFDYYQNEAKYRNELEKLNEDNTSMIRNGTEQIRKMSNISGSRTAETAAKRGRPKLRHKRKYDDATKLFTDISSHLLTNLNN